MAKPQLIKIDKGTKSHQHHVAHKTSSKAKPKKSSNTHNTHHSNHSQHAHHPQHTKTASSKSGSKHSRPKQSKTVTKHQSAPQHARAESITTPQTTHQRTTTHNENSMAEQHGALTLLKTDHLLLGPGGYEPTIATEQGKQLNNIDLLNKYYPGLGQMAFQPVLQLLPTNPLLARQWADVTESSQQTHEQTDINKNMSNQLNTLEQTDEENKQSQRLEEVKRNNKNHYDVDREATGCESFQGICGQGFGHVSAAHESSSGRDLVSSGKGDHGGASTGCWSISKPTMKDFISWCKRHGCRYGSKLTTAKPGTRKFRELVASFYKENSKAFSFEQYNFIYETHYKKAMEKLRAAGYPVDSFTQAEKEMVFSRAVQHGPGAVSKIFTRAGVTPSDSPRDKITKVYGLIEKHVNGYCNHCDRKVKHGVRNRMEEEPRELLRELEKK